MESDAGIRADVSVPTSSKTGVHKNSMARAVWAPSHKECRGEYCAWRAAPYCSGDKKKRGDTKRGKRVMTYSEKCESRTKQEKNFN
jgi:hypothetical protein